MDLERSEMIFRIDGQPDYAFATVQVPAGQTLRVEHSAMAAMSPNMSLKSKFGFKSSLKRMVSGEHMFISEYTAEGADGEVCIAPGPPGDMAHVLLEPGDTIFLQNSAFVACGTGVQVDTQWQGLYKGFFGREGFFLIRCSGIGDLFFNTYGAIIEIEVDGDYVVDNGYVVAWTAGLDYEVRRIGGYKSLFFSGEGLVTKFRGRGMLWVQTRKAPSFATWVHPFRPPPPKND